MLAGGYGERSPGREPFEGALLLPHLRLGGGARRRPLPERGEILRAFEDGTWRIERTDGTLIKEGSE
jgi:hypothetical protein